MIFLSIVTVALGVTAIALVCLALWPDDAGQPSIDELEARRRLSPDTGNVDRVDDDEVAS